MMFSWSDYWSYCSMFDDVKRRVRAVRRHSAHDPAIYRVVRQFVQHALRHSERTDPLMDVATERQRRLHTLHATDLPSGSRRRRSRLPLD